MLCKLGAQIHALGLPVTLALREENPALRALLDSLPQYFLPQAPQQASPQAPAHFPPQAQQQASPQAPAHFPPHFPQQAHPQVPASPIPCCHWDELRLSPEHCLLFPEGWPQALLTGLQAKARCVMYVQNWAYFLSNLPQDMPFDRLPLRFLAVSEPVRHFIRYSTGQDCPVLRPSIDASLFHPLPREAEAAHKPADGPLRVAYMPRKNSALARHIREAASARLRYAQPHISLEWVEIHNKNPQEVAQMLRESHIFLATGFPEGLGLPPLEAMASGCVVVGFTGMGGWDYMRPAPYPTSLSSCSAPPCPAPPCTAPEYDAKPVFPTSLSSCSARPCTAPPCPAPPCTAPPCTAQAQHESPPPHAPLPPVPLRPVPWGGNGFYAADADVLGAAQALEQACVLLYKGGPELAALRGAAAQCAASYAPQAHADAVQSLWNTWLYCSSSL